MAFFDIASFEVESGLRARLGYKRIYVNGKDIEVVPRPKAARVPQIVVGDDPGLLINWLRDANVIGVIFKDNQLSKKVIEKAAELRKTIFVPVNQFFGVSPQHRGARMGKARKIILSSHKLSAQVRMVSMASSTSQLLSVSQMEEMAKLLCGERGAQLTGRDFV